MDAATQETIDAIIAASPVVALTLPERAAVALGTAAHEITLRELLTNSAGILAITNKAGREECHSAYMVLKNARCAITNLAEEATEDAKKFTKAVKAESVRLHEITAAEEGRLLILRDQYDAAEQARKDAAIAAERAAMAAIQSRMDVIRDIPSRCANVSAAGIHDMVRALYESDVTFELFGDQLTDARELKQATLGKLLVLHDAALASEAAAHAAEAARIAEAARVFAEREQLAVDRAVLAEQQRVARIESDRIAAEQAVESQRLADLAAQQAADARKVAAQAAAEQVERNRVQAEAQRKMDEQQAQIAAQMAELTRAQDEVIARQEAAENPDADHADALYDNMIFDARATELAHQIADEATELARCTATAQAMLTNGRSLLMDDAETVPGAMPDDEPAIDYEAIAWAYTKLLAYGIGNASMENAMMLDRLNLMLLTAGVDA